MPMIGPGVGLIVHLVSISLEILFSTDQLGSDGWIMDSSWYAVLEMVNLSFT